VSLGKDNFGGCNSAIVDINSDPQLAFDGFLGFAKMGFRKVCFDFEKRVLRMGVLRNPPDSATS
jgi:hypothetical protein